MSPCSAKYSVMVASSTLNEMFADEERGARLLWNVAELLSTIEAALLRRLSITARLTGLREIHADVAAIKEGTVLLLKSGNTSVNLDELDVAVTLASARVAVGDDADALDLAKFLEFTREPFLVDVPAEVADEEIASGVPSARRRR